MHTVSAICPPHCRKCEFVIFDHLIWPDSVDGPTGRQKTKVGIHYLYISEKSTLIYIYINCNHDYILKQFPLQNICPNIY